MPYWGHKANCHSAWSAAIEADSTNSLPGQIHPILLFVALGNGKPGTDFHILPLLALRKLRRPR